jgi:hypothetical protein
MRRYRLRQGKPQEHLDGRWVPWTDAKQLRSVAQAVVRAFDEWISEPDIVLAADAWSAFVKELRALERTTKKSTGPAADPAQAGSARRRTRK